MAGVFLSWEKKGLRHRRDLVLPCLRRLCSVDTIPSCVLLPESCLLHCFCLCFISVTGCSWNQTQAWLLCSKLNVQEARVDGKREMLYLGSRQPWRDVALSSVTQSCPTSTLVFSKPSSNSPLGGKEKIRKFQGSLGRGYMQNSMVSANSHPETHVMVSVILLVLSAVDL